MEALSSNKLMKAQDPIWKRLYINRINMAVLLVMAIIAIYFYALSVHTNLTFENTYLVLFWAAVILLNGFGLITSDRYWSRIGQLRLAILRGEQDIQPFLASYQIRPEECALEIPASLRMVWNRTILITVAVLTGILVVILFIFGVTMVLQNSPEFTTFLFVTLFILALFLSTILIFYFTNTHYQKQMVTLTEEGLETRYLRQKRFIRWEDARLFATYGAQGIKKSNVITTYELSNEQIVVRWSQQISTSIFLKVESSTVKQEDWNELISRVNAYVAARTNLPLLDLNNAQQARHTRTTVRQYQQQHQKPVSSKVATSPTTVQIAKNDPVMRRLRLRNGIGTGLGVIGGLGLMAILFACYGMFWSTPTKHSGLLDASITHFLLGSGIFSLFFALLFLWLISTGTKFQARLQAQRQQAILHPERFHAAEQPIPSLEQPQPVSIKLGMHKKSFFLITFIEGFIVWFIFAILLFPSLLKTPLSILITIVVLACITLALSPLMMYFTHRASKTSIEVSAEGISTRTGTMESHMRWQDVRLFARYRPIRLLRRTPSPIWLYELDSEQTIVRWQWPHSQKRRMVLEPAMTQDDYDRWLDQLQRYVMARTDLPLLEFDVSKNRDTALSGQ